MRCDRCGKFRKAQHCVTSDFGDESEEMVTECFWCMSVGDYVSYHLANHITPEETTP